MRVWASVRLINLSGQTRVKAMPTRARLNTSRADEIFYSLDVKCKLRIDTRAPRTQGQEFSGVFIVIIPLV